MDLKELKVDDLRRLAREKGLAGFSGMKRTELIEALEATAKVGTGKVTKAKVGTKAEKSPKATKSVKSTRTAKGAKAADPSEAKFSEPVILARESTPVMPGGPVVPTIPEENLGVLPENYDEDRIVVVPRDPDWTWVHWQLSDTTRNNGYSVVPGGRTVLRVFLENERGGSTVFEHGIDDGVTRWYVRVGSEDRFVSVEVGLRGTGDRFASLIRSRRTPLPVARLRPGEARFLTVDPRVSLRELRARGDLPSTDEPKVPGRILSEDEFRALFGIPEPASKPR